MQRKDRGIQKHYHYRVQNCDKIGNYGLKLGQENNKDLEN